MKKQLNIMVNNYIRKLHIRINIIKKVSKNNKMIISYDDELMMDITTIRIFYLLIML